MAAKKRKRGRKKAPFQVKGSKAAKAHMAKARAALKRLVAKGRSCGTRKRSKKSRKK